MGWGEGLHGLKELEGERSESEPPQVWRHGNYWTMLLHTIQGMGQSGRTLERWAWAMSCKVPRRTMAGKGGNR